MFKAMSLYGVKEKTKEGSGILNLSHFTDEYLTCALQKLNFVPCPKSHEKSYGWAPITFSINDDEKLYAGAMGIFSFCLKIETRSVASSLLKEMVLQKSKELVREGRNTIEEVQSMSREIKASCRNEAIAAAASKYELINCFLDVNKGILAINSSSASKCETVIDALHKTFEQLSFVSLRRLCEAFNVNQISNWVRGDAPESLFVGSNIKIKSSIDDAKPVITCKNIDVCNDKHILECLDQAWTIESIELCVNKIGFTMSKQLIFSAINWSYFIETKEDEDADNSDDDFMASSLIYMEAASGLFTFYTTIFASDKMTEIADVAA